MNQITVLIVDDSLSMRKLIAATLSRDERIRVVGEAADPFAARQAIKELNPDVLTLDVELPNMNGIEFLKKIMRLRPMPVVMVSSLTDRAAAATISALECGAVACIAKPTIKYPKSFDELAPAVRTAALTKSSCGRKPVGRLQTSRSSDGILANANEGPKVVGLGASTGGVEALISILERFPRNCPPTVIVQHMPALFTRSFAQRLDSICAAEVCEASEGAPLLPNKVYVAPGGSTHLEVRGTTSYWCRLRQADPVQGHRPSVDVLFSSLARSVGSSAVGVILTGMGRDGAAGLLEMRLSGARTLGQDEATSVVFGMPKVAREIGAVDRLMPLADIPAAIFSGTRNEKRGHRHGDC